MNDLIATLNHIRGETISFGLRALDPPYDGTETVTCAVKKARNGVQVPPVSEPVVLIASVDFVAGSDDTPAAWVFGLTPEQSASLEPGEYITDAKVVYANGTVDYTKPLAMRISERVTT